MSKSDEKTLVKKPDIIMEQLEDRIVFAADVAHAAPVVAATAQAQAHSDPAAGGGAHAPDAPHHDATAAQDHGPSSHMDHVAASSDPTKVDLAHHDHESGGGKSFWIDATAGAKMFHSDADAKVGSHETSSGSEGSPISIQMQQTAASGDTGAVDLSQHHEGGAKTFGDSSFHDGAKMFHTDAGAESGTHAITSEPIDSHHVFHTDAVTHATDSADHSGAKLDFFTAEHNVHQNYVVNETLDSFGSGHVKDHGAFQYNASDGNDHHGGDHAKTMSFHDASDSHNLTNASIANTHDLTHGLNLTDPNASTSAGVNVLVVASNVQDYQTLVHDAAPGVLTVVYNPNTDSLHSILAKIETALGGHKADSIAFATEGEGLGQFELTSNYIVSSSSLLGSAQLEHFWKDVGSLVNNGGTVDLLACGVVANQQGNLLLSELETLTGRQIAASSDATGNAEYGGNWVLESDGVNIAPIFFNVSELGNYTGLLASPSLGGISGTVNYNENAGAQIVDSAVTITESGSPNIQLATVKISSGYVSSQDSLGIASGYTLPSGVTASWSSSTGTLTITGSATEANYVAILEHVTYTDSSENPTAANRTLQWVVQDVSGHNSTTATDTLHVTNTDTAPVISAPATVSVEQGDPLAFTGGNLVTVTDPQNNTVSTTLTALHGTLTAGSYNGTSITITGSPSAVSSQLASLTYQPNSGYTGSDSITVSTVETATGAKLSAPNATIAVTVTADHAPVLTAPSSLSTAEVTAFSLTGANAIKITDADNDVVSVTVSAAHGTLTAGSQSGASITFTDTPANVTADLASLTYTPTAGYHGTDSISVNVAETASAHLTASSSIGVTVTGDQAPILTAPSALSTAEGTAINFTGSNAIQITDAENDQVTVTVAAAHGTLTAGTQTGSTITFTDTASNVTADLAALKYTPTTGYHGTDSISVNVVPRRSSNHLTAASVVGVTVTGDAGACA